MHWGQNHVRTELTSTIICVRLASGATGEAEAVPLPQIYGETTASMTAIVEDIASLLRNVDILDTRKIASALSFFMANNAVKAGIDMACAVARVRAQGGDYPDLIDAAHDKVEVTYIVSIADGDELINDIGLAYNNGVRSFKIKVGRDHRRDLQRIKLIQSTFPDIRFYIDANETFTPADSLERLRDFASLGAFMAEEPLPIQNVQARRDLRAAAITPIVADDSVFTARDVERELEIDAFDILNIKPNRTGFTTSMSMIDLASGAGKGVTVGSQSSSSLGALQTAVLAFSAGVNWPCELSSHFKLYTNLVDFPKVREGYLHWQDLVDCRVDPSSLMDVLQAEAVMEN